MTSKLRDILQSKLAHTIQKCQGNERQTTLWNCSRSKETKDTH